MAKGRKALRRKRYKAVGRETVRGRRLSQLKKIGEKMRLKRKPDAETKKKKRQTLKVLGHAFEGSFNVTMKNTADFIKKRQKKRRNKNTL